MIWTINQGWLWHWDTGWLIVVAASIWLESVGLLPGSVSGSTEQQLLCYHLQTILYQYMYARMHHTYISKSFVLLILDYTHTHTHTHAHTHTHVHTTNTQNTHTHTHTHTQIHTCAHKYTCSHTRTYICLDIHIHTYIRRHMHAHIRTCAHTLHIIFIWYFIMLLDAHYIVHLLFYWICSMPILYL